MNRERLRRGLLWTGAAGVLAAVFAAYLQPEMAAELARQAWAACF